MNGDVLLQLLYASAKAYRDQSPFRRGFRSEFVECEKADLQCRLWFSQTEVFVAFRGTDSLRDVQLDVKFKKQSARRLTGEEKSKIHRGFLEAFFCENFQEKLFSKLKNSGAQKIYFTGHSLGGAMAVLAALDYRLKEQNSEIWVITFGCPRVGNRAFCRLYERKILEVVHVQNGNDIVTKMPPRLFGYSLPGAVYHIGKRRVIGAFSAKEHRQKAYFERLLPVCFR